MYEIVIGRTEKDRESFGLKGTIFIGKQYVKMEQTTSLASDVYLDVVRSHVYFIVGKRGSGKSYTLSVIAEGMALLEEEIKQNLAVLMFDTMGIFWTMKYPNRQQESLLKEWNLESKELPIIVYVPKGYFNKLKEEGLPVDFPFALKPRLLSATDWIITFNLEETSEAAVLITRVINKLQEKDQDYSIQDIIEEVSKDEKASTNAKNLVESYFLAADSWGLFDVNAPDILELVKPGTITVLDVSIYSMMSNAWAIKNLVIGLVSAKLFAERMKARKTEEFSSVESALHYFVEEKKTKKMPLVWLFLDEAHESLPKEGKTTASDALITILREGRQPGISLVLATQQPGKIHTDVITQADAVIAHRLTAKIDIEALQALAQTYMRGAIEEQINMLPRVKGAAVVFDDINERVFSIQVRPKLTWHGGSSPRAIEEKKEIF